MRHFVVAILSVVSFTFAENCAQIYMKARPAANYYNHLYTTVKESNQHYSGDRVLWDEVLYFSWNGSANEYVIDSAVRVDGRWPENNATLYKDSGTYALYKEESSQGSMVSYSNGKKYEEGTIDYSGDTLIISHVLYGDYKRAHLTTMKMHISNDTLHYYQDSYIGYPDTVDDQDTSRYFLIDNPEKENHCLQYYYNSDKNEWVKSSSDISYAFKGDTLIFSRRLLDIDDIYEDKVNYLVLNSVLFDKHTTKAGFHRRKPYSTLSNKGKYHDVKGGLHSKTIPYRVLFGIGE
ncbi:hypothetical protein Fisuc_2357 [Fibrobacter succinogenes subsp. succinogenes S85]|nr:hypothetical protein Fisuc_2357 [Fibrobacter succinogenes subsp. succinogenes S85]